MPKIIGSFILLLAFSAQAQLKMYVTLNPAGDFVAETAAVTGQAQEKADGTIVASDIKVDVKTLKTGINLRDEHMINKYLEAAKHPFVTLKVAKAKDGKGEAILIVKGKQGKVAGTYAKAGNKLNAKFDLKISDFGIEDISYKGIGVDDLIKIEVSVPVVKQAAAAAKPAAKATVKPKPAAPKK